MARWSGEFVLGPLCVLCLASSKDWWSVKVCTMERNAGLFVKLQQDGRFWDGWSRLADRRGGWDGSGVDSLTSAWVGPATGMNLT